MDSARSPKDRISGAAHRRALRMGAPLATLAVIAAGLTQGAQAATGTASPSPAAVGSVSAAPAGAKAAAAPAASTEVSGEVLLNTRNQAALTSYAQAVSNPKSRFYRQYLSPAQIQAQFAPSSSEVNAVDAALRAVGLTPGAALGDNLAIPFNATLGQLHTAFAVDFAGYQLADGRTAFGATSAPKVATTVAPYVDGVLGLNDFGQPQTNTKSVGTPVSASYSAPTSASAGASAEPSTGSHSAPTECSSLSGAIATYLKTQENGVPDVDGESFYSPAAMAKAYGTDSQLAAGNDGQGVSTAVLEWGPVSQQALADYESCYKLANPISYVNVDGGPQTPPSPTYGGTIEAALDIEDIAGLAPGTSIIDYQGIDLTSPNFTDANWLDPMTKAVTDDKAKVISISIELCEPSSDRTIRSGETTDFELAAIEGQSVFVSTGDAGSTGCNEDSGTDQISVDDPADSPWVTATGGTSMQGMTNPSIGVWNDSTYELNGRAGTGGGAGGGGVSAAYALTGIENYQAGFTGPGFSNACSAKAGSSCRQIPDISTLADWISGLPVITYASGTSAVAETLGGTSWSAPTMAAITTLTDASTGCRANGPVGFENPELYGLASDSASYAKDFSDIASGNNDYTPSGYTGGLYAAAKGYDLATGLGSPKAATLIPALCTGW